ncbi:GGDEF domain-containing protein [Desulfogranum japonicum]|uniref:GGDEF domain-containing protein n=1 Tax=Desulfogranum japonicum TaxID=231447 RepID=UPI001378026A|nr:GGDEF domain-containing protein [Desulfogranum japonicum]
MQEYRRAQLLNFFLPLMAAVLLIASYFNVVTFRFYMVACIEAGLGIISLVAWFWFRKTLDPVIPGWTVSTITGFITIMLLLYTQGQRDSYALTIIYPLIAYPIHGVRKGSLAYALYLLIVIGTILYGTLHWPFVSASSSLFNMLVVLLMGGGIILYNEIVKEEAVQKAHDVSMCDPLTGIWNRTMFEELLDREIEHCRRYHRPFTLIMCDLDHFKRVNDLYGHQTGDKVLQEFVSIIKQRKRSVDHFSRWGGEEFMLILPNTELADAEKFAMSLIQQVRNFRFSGAGKLTVSMGIGEFDSSHDRNAFFKEVDQALYKAKQMGRDRYCNNECCPEEFSGPSILPTFNSGQY